MLLTQSEPRSFCSTNYCLVEHLAYSNARKLHHMAPLLLLLPFPRGVLVFKFLGPTFPLSLIPIPVTRVLVKLFDRHRFADLLGQNEAKLPLFAYYRFLKGFSRVTPARRRIGRHKLPICIVCKKFR